MSREPEEPAHTENCQCCGNPITDKLGKPRNCVNCGLARYRLSRKLKLEYQRLCGRFKTKFGVTIMQALDGDYKLVEGQTQGTVAEHSDGADSTAE